MFPSLWKFGLLSVAIAFPLYGEDSFDSRLFQTLKEQQNHERDLERLLDAEHDLRSANTQYQLAKKRNSGDPRLEFAIGLVHLAHYEYDEAEKRFREATQIAKVHYLPAWQAVIHLDLLQNQREKFLDDTLKLAELAAKPDAEWIGSDRPEAAASWLGEVCEYLKLHGVDFLDPAGQEAHDIQLTESLTPELVAAWVEGQTELRRKYVRLHQEIEQQKQDAKGEIQKTSSRKTAELKDRQQSIEQEQENSRKSGVEWKAWHDKQMKQTKTQLTTLQKDYATLEAGAKRLNGIIGKLQFEIGQLQTVSLNTTSRSQRNPAGAGFGGPSQLEMTIAVKQQELLRLQLQYAALEQKALAVVVNARKVLHARQQAAAKYKNATGEIVRRDETLARWEKVVEKTSIKAAAKANKTDPLEALEKRLTMATSYFPLDFETEKDRVLKSYKQP